MWSCGPRHSRQRDIVFLCTLIPLINHLLWSLFQGLNSASLVNTIRDFVTSSNLSSMMAFLLPGVSYFIFFWENSRNKENTGYKHRLEGHYKLSAGTTDETQEASQLWTLSPWTGMDVGSQSLVILSGLYLGPKSDHLLPATAGEVMWQRMLSQKLWSQMCCNPRQSGRRRINSRKIWMRKINLATSPSSRTGRNRYPHNWRNE